MITLEQYFIVMVVYGTLYSYQVCSMLLSNFEVSTLVIKSSLNDEESRKQAKVDLQKVIDDHPEYTAKSIKMIFVCLSIGYCFVSSLFWPFHLLIEVILLASHQKTQ